MTKILGIVGSPRKKGNTDILVDKILEGAKGSGAEIEKPMAVVIMGGMLTSTFLTLVVLALLAVTLQSLVFSGASFLSSSQNPSQSFAAGTVSHINSRDGVAIVTAAGLRPGTSAQGTVTITGGEDVPAAYSAVNAGITDAPATPGLSSVLRLRIDDVTGAPQTLYNGALSAFGTVGLATIAPYQARTFRFTLTWPLAAADPALQAASTTVAVQFLGVSL